MLKKFKDFCRRLKRGEQEKGKPEPNCYIADATKRPATFAFECLEPELIPVASREREYKGYLVHFLSRQRNETLLPVEGPYTLEKNEETPPGIYAALNPPGLEYLLGLSPSAWKKATTIILSIIIVLEIIFGFIILGGKL